MSGNKFSGAKGGGGGSAQAAVRTPDNLRSKDTVEVILGIAEGPIYGLKDGAKSFYIGDTQLQNVNGAFNFSTVQLQVRPGTDADEAIIPMLGGQSSNSSVNVTLFKGTAVTRQTQSGAIDFIDVRMVISHLESVTDTGSYGTSVTFSIEYKALSSGTWIKAYGEDITLKGKTTSPYVYETRIPVDKIGEPYEIRVTKYSDENTTSYFANISWESFQETIAGDVYYPNTATAHLVVESSDQFSSIPQWSGIYRGLLIRLPSNYDPSTRTYTGVWDGSWQIAWSNNPAWCLYDYVSNDRYGMRAYYPDLNLDKYDVYEAGRWCDEMVPDGRGGMQPRYTFNAYITEARPGKELARYIAGVFNSALFDDLNGTAYLKVDKDDNANHLFTIENVYEGVFEYSYTDITSRYNDITVSFRNPNLNWSEDRRRVANNTMIGQNGRIPLDFIAVGCIDEHEAIRRAQYKLITANTETCIVQFKTNRLGQFVKPFDVVLIADPDMGYGLSGRVKEVLEDRTKISLRTPLYLEAGVSYDITFTMADGTYLKTNLVNTVKGYNTVLEFGAPLPETNLPDRTVFSLEHPVYIGLPRPFRVTKVIEEDGNPDMFSIEAININRNKWYDSDNVTDSGVVVYGVLPSVFDPPGPIDVTFSERFIRPDRAFHLTISAIFDRGAYKYYSNTQEFEVWSRLRNGDQPYIKRTLVAGDTIINHPPGIHEFKILGISYLGTKTDLDSATVYIYDVANPLAPPKDIDWIRANEREFYWGYSDEPDDFDGFQLRYHNQAGRTTWDDAARPHQGLLSATSFYTNLVPPSARVIMVRPVDLFGVTSVNSAILFRDAGSIVAVNVVDDFEYHPTFSGTKEGCSVDAGSLKADDTGGQIYSGVPTALIYDGGDMYESTYFEMLYTDSFTTTASGKLSFIIDFEGSGYEISIRPDGDVNWQPVSTDMPVTPGTYEFKVKVFGGKTRGIIHELTAIVDAVDISEDIQDVNVMGGTIRLPITKNYTTIKLVSVIIQGGGTAFTYRVLDKDPVLGPMIELLDMNGDPADGLIDATVKGF